MLGACVVFTGCASVMNETTHTVRVDTKNSAGQMVSGADCRLSNDASAQSIKSGDIVNVRRSSGDLDITCKHPENPDALGRLISRVNGGMFGNIILGGAIGMVVDHTRGTAYTYPTWVQLVFGKTLTFDRTSEVDGQPVQGVEPGTPATTARSPKVTPPAAPVATPTPEPASGATTATAK
jgi:hypothetical protein